MSRFTFEQLHTFALVIEHETFDAAADVLHVSASAVSQRIKAMEHAAGRVLLKRTNPVTPTETGQIVLRLARQSDYLNQELEQELGGEGGYRTVAIAVNADSLATWLLDAVALLAREDRIFCDLRREGEQYSSALLYSGEAMAAITSHPEPIPSCTVEKLGMAKYWVVSSSEFAERSFGNRPHGVTIQELNTAPVIEYDRKDVGQDLARSLLLAEFGLRDDAAGQAPSVYVPSSPDYARAVDMGIGWGIIPEQQCAEGLKNGRLVKLVEDPVEFPLYWQRWKVASELLDRVTERVYAAAAHAWSL